MPEMAEAPEATKLSPEQKKEIEQIVKSYLVANPEIFVDIQHALEEKVEKEQTEKLKVAVAGECRGDLSRARRFRRR